MGQNGLRTELRTLGKFADDLRTNFITHSDFFGAKVTGVPFDKIC